MSYPGKELSMNAAAEPASMRRLFLFFVPMGLSVLLINLSHVIINGTLARSADPELILAGYAIGMSLVAITERPSILLRNTCSALVRDQLSFSAVRRIGYIVFGATLLFGAMLAYSPVGHLVFAYAFGADAQVEREAVVLYRVLMFVSIFSGLRCLYQGIIIYKMQTRWMTFAMLFRLTGMFVLSQYFLQTGVGGAYVGGVIFLFGMMIEAGISWWQSNRLLRQMPVKAPEVEVERVRQVMPFYKPLLYSSLVIVWVLPILNIMLGTTERGTLAVASFAVAGSLMNLMLGFFSYFHQISLMFVKSFPGLVRRFTLTLGFIPLGLMLMMCFTPIGSWMFSQVLGVKNELLDACVHALRGYLPLVLIFPWLDTLNGIVMANGETKLMFRSQLANATCTAAVIVTLTLALPSWSGVLGSLAQSSGVLAELVFLVWLFRRSHRADL